MLRMTDLHEDLHECDTQVAPQYIEDLAWSQAPNIKRVKPYHDRSSVRWIAGALVSIPLLAGLIAFLPSHQDYRAPIPVPAGGTPDPVQTVDAPPPPLNQIPDVAPKDAPDTIFQRAYAIYVPNLYISNPAQAISYAHVLCEWMQDHESSTPARTAEAAAWEIHRAHSETTIEDSRGIVLASSRAYCPRYDTGEN